MLKNLMKTLALKLGYEVKKISVKYINNKSIEPSRKVNINEDSEKELDQILGISFASNLLLTPKFNDISFTQMTNFEDVWGFTKCSAGDHEFLMALMGNDDGVALRFYNNGYYEKFTMTLWASLSCKSKTILDIGAHTGSYTIAARTANQSAKVISIEPHYLNFSRLALNLRANGYQPSDIYMIAASDSNDYVYFQVPKGDGYHSSGGTVAKTGRNISQDGYWVNAVSLDNFLQGSTKSTLDLLKIDVEGYEVNVLKGMSKIISDIKPTIFFECITDSNNELEEFFKENNYKIYYVDDKKEIIMEVENIKAIYDENNKLDMYKLNRIAIDPSKNIHYEAILHHINDQS